MRSIQFICNGEIGWETIHWQAYCRKRAKDFDLAFAHSVNPSMAPLYTDFAEDDFRRTNVTECWVKDRLIPFDRQEFIKYGDKESKVFIIPEFGRCVVSIKALDYILIHARQSKNVSKNYPVEHWEHVVATIRTRYGPQLRIYCIGSHAEAVHINGTIDLRGIQLNILFDVMANAKCIIGPSSGPMHLASLCDCHAVVWGDGRTYRGQFLRDRYQTSWNPFKTPVEFIETGLNWIAKPEEIMERAGRFL